MKTTSDRLEVFREEIKNKMLLITADYIDAVLLHEGYNKGNLHWKLMDYVCAYLKGEPYDSYEDAGLRPYLHDETKKITDNLEDIIGLDLERKWEDISNHELDEYSEKLVLEICKFALEIFPDIASIIAFKDAEPKPCKLESPFRGVTKNEKTYIPSEGFCLTGD